MPLSRFPLLFLCVVACGGKTLDDSVDRELDDGGAGGGAQEPPSSGGAASLGDASSALDAGGPPMPPPDVPDDAAAEDPEALARERCQRFCELPEVQCQHALGGNPTVCADGCVTTTLRQQTAECRDMFLGMITCVEDILREVNCEEQYSPGSSGPCTDLATTYAYSCPPQPDRQ